ncbi:MAG: Sec-independent protein translocase subunit TatA/TatB [Gammaproteobacteria bacterium]
MHIPFSEILVILIVALLVIKPERLPEVALKLGRLIKWMRQSITKIKSSIHSDHL